MDNKEFETVYVQIKDYDIDKLQEIIGEESKKYGKKIGIKDIIMLLIMSRFGGLIGALPFPKIFPIDHAQLNNPKAPEYLTKLCAKAVNEKSKEIKRSINKHPDIKYWVLGIADIVLPNLTQENVKVKPILLIATILVMIKLLLKEDKD